jgi:N-acetyl-anhydromuramyl-L-alanine amidase AmpD
LNRWGIHCGQTYHPELGYNLDNKLVGIEVCCAGIVKKQGTIYKPDWNETFSEAEVTYSDKVENVTEPGHYHKFNDVQEQTLLQLLIWLKTNNPSVFKLEYVLGHDEIATTGPKGSAHAKTLGRKQDPGASLSVYMKEYRQKLLAAIPVS